jgi:hypothetical protein
VSRSNRTPLPLRGSGVFVVAIGLPFPRYLLKAAAAGTRGSNRSSCAFASTTDMPLPSVARRKRRNPERIDPEIMRCNVRGGDLVPVHAFEGPLDCKIVIPFHETGDKVSRFCFCHHLPANSQACFEPISGRF